MATRGEMSRSFGAAAAAYDVGRPEYPSAAVAWMLQPLQDAHPRVVDVGAGTGKLTAALVAQGAQTVAVDPDEAMLARLSARIPGIPVHLGTAEALPLPDASADAIVLGQAWHWVDPVAACAEISRVLRPGGVLGLIWNIRDERIGWVAEMTRIMHGSNAEALLAAGGPVVTAPFGRLEQRLWEWEAPMTREALWDLARSRSYVITAEPAERVRIERELGELFDRIGMDGRGSIALPYVTQAFRAVRG